jgi:hypothetical protein
VPAAAFVIVFRGNRVPQRYEATKPVEGTPLRSHGAPQATQQSTAAAAERR